MLELVNKSFQLDPDLMTYPCFRKIWERDTTEDKLEAFAYLAFIFHFNNPKSPYYAYSEAKRKDEIILRLFPEHMKTEDLKLNMNNDADLVNASNIYLEDLQLSPYRSVIDSAKQALEMLSSQFKDANITVDQKLGNIAKITRGMEELKKAEKLCDDDEINSRVKGRRIIKKREV